MKHIQSISCTFHIWRRCFAGALVVADADSIRSVINALVLCAKLFGDIVVNILISRLTNGNVNTD